MPDVFLLGNGGRQIVADVNNLARWSSGKPALELFSSFGMERHLDGFIGRCEFLVSELEKSLSLAPERKRRSMGGRSSSDDSVAKSEILF